MHVMDHVLVSVNRYNHRPPPAKRTVDGNISGQGAITGSSVQLMEIQKVNVKRFASKLKTALLTPLQ